MSQSSFNCFRRDTVGKLSQQGEVNFIGNREIKEVFRDRGKIAVELGCVDCVITTRLANVCLGYFSGRMCDDLFEFPETGLGEVEIELDKHTSDVVQLGHECF